MRTDETWTRRIRSVSELPDRYQPFLSDDEPLPEILYTPFVESSLGETKDSVVALYDDRLLILKEGEDGSIFRVLIHYRDVRALDFGRVLLHSWITLQGADERGAFNETLEFCSAVESLFHPVIERFRRLQAGVPLTHADPSGAAHAELGFLLNTDFKFFSYANMDVPADGHIRSVLYEPEVRRKLASVVYLVSIPAQTLVLTDHELIRITEEKPPVSLYRIHAAYGAITSFVPLERIKTVDVLPGDEPDKVQLRLTLDLGQIVWSFAADEEATLRAFREHLLEMPIAA